MKRKSKMKEMSFLQMVSDAQKKKNHKVKIEIVNPGGEPIIAYLTPVNFVDMVRMNSVTRMKEYVYFMKECGDVPINLEQWKRKVTKESRQSLERKIKDLIEKGKESEIEKLKEDSETELKETLESPPANEAQVQAEAMALIKSSTDIIPRYLVDENDQVLLKSEEEIVTFTEIVKRDMDLRQTLLEAYNKLFELLREKREQAKNE